MIKGKMSNHMAGPIYGLGIFGALVYFIVHADGFWSVIFAFFKALVWPAFVVYGLLGFLHM